MNDERGMKVWEFLVFLGGLMAIAAVLFFAINAAVLPRIVHRNTVVLTPDVRGMTVERANLAVADQRLTVEPTRQRAHPEMAAGQILEQVPAAGSPIRSGRTIRVVTSSGPPAGAVPDLAGLSERQSEITLQREGFRRGRVIRLRRADVTAPTVVCQNPPAGRELRKGLAIDLVVGEPAPPELLCMPDLRGVPLHLARQRVLAAGCVLAPVSYVRTVVHEANLVLRQDPAPGRRIRKGERIELVATSP
ncbi:MAG TPA: PASTA domain-containing protein [Candidatus Krumholzibacteria bacterium]|nr:PASTA domain-containing protein [Candidatus Krumholzibacteria bacterium]HPD71379.1 PASTA domain-containing protein [Candidatus Krumholzibacteria bacterium]HRY38921.1 PASTA domain-containing protein [Candidatus Krumholzibacteria bacterium]